MIRGIYTAVSGMITQEAKQDVISNNLANVNTVGYKKDNLIAKKFEDVLIQNYDKVVNGKNVRNIIGRLSLGSKVDETYVDFTQGAVESTDSDTDFAIQGRGFFTVAHNNGTNMQNYYTRNGHFHIDNNGFLANDEGDLLLGRNINSGNIEPINVMANGRTGEIKCNENGEISINNVPYYRLELADFADYRTLIKAGDNLYIGENPTRAQNANIIQKSLEKSNVDVMAEMTDMIMTMRTYQSNQSVIQSIDETLNKVVNDVGKV